MIRYSNRHFTEDTKPISPIISLLTKHALLIGNFNVLQIFSRSFLTVEAIIQLRSKNRKADVMERPLLFLKSHVSMYGKHPLNDPAAKIKHPFDE